MKFRVDQELRVLCFDLENRPLAYWYDGETTSEITAFGWKWSDERTVQTMLLRNDDSFISSEGEVLTGDDAYTHFAFILEGAGIVTGHNIRRHDLPILNAGLLRRELHPLHSLLTSDTCKDLPKRGGLSYSLENMAAMYELKGKKFTMSQPAWEKANRLSDEGLALAHKRVVADVRLQEALRLKLIELGLLKEPRTWLP